MGTAPGRLIHDYSPTPEASKFDRLDRAVNDSGPDRGSADRFYPTYRSSRLFALRASSQASEEMTCSCTVNIGL